MADPSVTPVIIGVGDIVNRSLKIEDAVEPLELMFQAATIALKDTGLSSAHLEKLQSDIDSIDIIPTWTWPYRDLPGLLSDKLHVKVRHKHYGQLYGGNQPAKMVDQAARRTSNGGCRVALVTGGEALASCMLSPRFMTVGY